MSRIEVHVIAPDGVPIPLLAALGRVMGEACPGSTVGPCELGTPDCKVSIVGETRGAVVDLRPELVPGEFTVTVDAAAMSDRLLERVDDAVETLRSITGVTVAGWGEDE
jgi:hypothetical protein